MPPRLHVPLPRSPRPRKPTKRSSYLADRAAMMSRFRKTNSAPELQIRWLLRKLGVPYRTYPRSFPGTPDIVVPKAKTAIFVHGCFWHQHGCKLTRLPKTNHNYWLPKFARNKRRDAAAQKALRAMGWRPVVIWECQTFHSSTAAKLSRIASSIKKS
jgi:DNA mismatch endonuclease, patch repair protein